MGKLICVVGYNGVGKSVVAKELAKKLGYTLIDKNTVTEKLMDLLLRKLGITGKGHASAMYLHHLRNEENKVLKEVVNDNLRIGNNVVLSASLVREIGYEDWVKDFENLEDIKIINVVVKDSLVEFERLLHRNLEKDVNLLEDWDSYRENRLEMNCNWSVSKEDVIEFDNTEELTEEKIDKLISVL